MINRITSNNIAGYQNINFKGQAQEKTLTPKKKAVVLASAAMGMTPVLAILAKRKGFSLNPAKILKTPIKDWALLKFAPKNKAIQFEAPQIISVATGSVVGGFIGGAIVDDKANLKAKKREVLNQILGNVLVPVGCVWTGAEIYNKYADKLMDAMPQIMSAKKAAKVLNKCLRALPNAAFTIGFLTTGIFLGNRVSNLINEKLYHKKVERNIKATDFAPHVDDLCMAASMMNKNSSFGAKLGRIIPLALLVPGYQTGVAQEK